MLHVALASRQRNPDLRRLPPACTPSWPLTLFRFIFVFSSQAYFSEVSKKGVDHKEGIADKSGEFLRALREELRNPPGKT